jgi:ring-1,2-phenylacetyl-CoA epoxidase subunit PaaD
VVTAWEVAAAVPDPELPMVTLADLGILREVHDDGDTVVATITPTYSGCPAMREIGVDLEHRLHAAGYAKVAVRTRLSPPWSSDWITPVGRKKLAAAGIAPPNPAPSGPVLLSLTAHQPAVSCPHCGALGATRTAAFSGTACKSLYRCPSCDEPFEYVKAV